MSNAIRRDEVGEVATTGIYCQPMTGDGPAYVGDKAQLVCRAVRMIEEHALDGRTEADLAASLAVSPRHLRRLFVEYAGVTPDGLARSARAHFARRLLDDTDLSISRVAYAAGYTSVRQFNRACREIFHEPPGALRARRHKADKLIADGGLRLQLPFEGSLDWQVTLRYLAERLIPGVESVSGNVYRRTTRCSHPGVIELMPGDDEHLQLIAHLPHWQGLVDVVDRARHLANLDFPLGKAARILERHPSIGPLIRMRPGVRPPGTWDGFETGVYAILAQYVSPLAANAIVGRLVERHGTPVPGLGPMGLTHTFPSAETLAGADLDGLGLTERQRDDVHEFAQAVTSATIRLDRSVRLDPFVESVTALRGLGNLTAHYLAFRLGEPDAWPVSEHSSRLVDLAMSTRPWRALAATHLELAGGDHALPRQPFPSATTIVTAM